MWNLEETERLVLRLLPVVMLLVAFALVLMSFNLQPRELSRAFEPSQSQAVFMQASE